MNQAFFSKRNMEEQHATPKTVSAEEFDKMFPDFKKNLEKSKTFCPSAEHLKRHADMITLSYRMEKDVATALEKNPSMTFGQIVNKFVGDYCMVEKFAPTYFIAIADRSFMSPAIQKQIELFGKYRDQPRKLKYVFDLELLQQDMQHKKEMLRNGNLSQEQIAILKHDLERANMYQTAVTKIFNESVEVIELTIQLCNVQLMAIDQMKKITAFTEDCKSSKMHPDEIEMIRTHLDLKLQEYVEKENTLKDKISTLTRL